MPEPMPEKLFDALIAHAGLVLTPAQRASILNASRHLTAATERLRPQDQVALEPATVFRP
ncbi:hypothetical protein HB662_02615 [Roseomonas frigidaquae]|uniref:DUF4089 domain-containing protein n=1 Tax=Falsiroseomonas frigidaquae TaxID=487318 RepID=A0ABX1ESW3_9PROT|nr:hypothetical protein [Falsiroseomonas frigidaquae]NKE43652.1 hypothetical protein [Falsiroseomonas frigidaquae]